MAEIMKGVGLGIGFAAGLVGVAIVLEAVTSLIGVSLGPCGSGGCGGGSTMPVMGSGTPMVPVSQSGLY